MAIMKNLKEWKKCWFNNNEDGEDYDEYNDDDDIENDEGNNNYPGDYIDIVPGLWVQSRGRSFPIRQSIWHIR